MKCIPKECGVEDPTKRGTYLVFSPQTRPIANYWDGVSWDKSQPVFNLEQKIFWFPNK